MLTNEEVIAELLRMAEEIKRCEEKGNELGLTIEEKAFYDALSSPQGVKDAYSNEEFIQLTKELTEQLRKNRTIDWNHKDSARAKMRVLVKRLLKKYHYPPEGQEQALQTVMAQCNKWADDEGNFQPINETMENRNGSSQTDGTVVHSDGMNGDAEPSTSNAVSLRPVDYLKETSAEEEMSKAAEEES